MARRSRRLRGLAGVVDANVALVHVNKKEKHQEMHANKMDTKERVRGLGDAYARRKWRSAATSGGAPARDCGGLGAWGGVGCAGNGRGSRGTFIGVEMVRNRGLYGVV